MQVVTSRNYKRAKNSDNIEPLRSAKIIKSANLSSVGKH